MVLKAKSSSEERKHVAKAEETFRIVARRNRLLGQWAADRLGLSGDDATAYAREVVAADLDEPGDADLLRKVLGDFAAKGIAISEAEVRAELNTLMETARAQIAAETT